MCDEACTRNRAPQTARSVEAVVWLLHYFWNTVFRARMLYHCGPSASVFLDGVWQIRSRPPLLLLYCLCNGVMVQWCNPLTLQPEQSGGSV